MFMPIGGNCGYAITPNHSHPAYMFVISYDNETEVYIDNKKLQPYPNTIFCLSPEIQHHEVQNYLPPKYCAIFIQKEFFQAQCTYYTKEPIYFNGDIVEIKSSKLDTQIKEFINETYNEHPSKESVLTNIALLLTHEIIRNVLNYTPHSIQLSENIILNRAIAFINTHYSQNITIEALANLSQLSSSHFSKLFSDSMQISPMTYLKRIRLQNAKKMLLSNQLSITQVAQQCGFNSSAYFSKLFKESFNETPKEFMKRVYL